MIGLGLFTLLTEIRIRVQQRYCRIQEGHGGVIWDGSSAWSCSKTDFGLPVPAFRMDVGTPMPAFCEQTLILLLIWLLFCSPFGAQGCNAHKLGLCRCTRKCVSARLIVSVGAYLDRPVCDWLPIFVSSSLGFLIAFMIFLLASFSLFMFSPPLSQESGPDRI